MRTSCRLTDREWTGRTTADSSTKCMTSLCDARGIRAKGANDVVFRAQIVDRPNIPRRSLS